ncbi:MAG: endonuclease/exonuclease/phosphatase family protein [Saprospiraceae bacterium]|nr:endonuclease/exonuclease/phosphatase family protein [Saprospiraceae bacterium]MCB9344303.1 endonuclease/exonuclease/phosphatase family protein [Lewinellaceae bacterium]
MPKNITILLLFFSTIAFSQKGDDYEVASIGFYNLENLFDTIDSPTTRDYDFLPAGRLHWDSSKYYIKQANLAKVIALLGTDLSPDGVALLGVAEVENRQVLEDLVIQKEIESRHYQIVHYDSPDERGIDVGLLYQPKYFSVLGSKAFPVDLIDKETKEPDYTRDVLYVAGLFNGEPMHILVNHWPSRGGGEARTAYARAAAASVCKSVADSIKAVDEDAKIIVMGDLNDDPDSKSLTQVLKARRSADDLKKSELYNPMFDIYKNGNGTLAYRDSWNLFDQLIVSKGLVNKKTGGWQLYKAQIFKQPWMFQTEGAFRGYPLRTFVGDIFLNGYSDHLPVYMYLLKKKESPAPQAEPATEKGRS